MGKFFIGIVILSVGILLVYLHVIALQYLAYIRLFKSILMALTLVPALAAASLTAGADGSCIPTEAHRTIPDHSCRSSKIPSSFRTDAAELPTFSTAF